MENKLKNATESISEICGKFLDFLKEVLSGKRKSDDNCLENYAKASRNVTDVMNNEYDDDDKKNKLDEADEFLNEAEKYKGSGFGPVLEDVIPSLRGEIEKLRKSTSNNCVI
ncbi:MAG: hypothetical protein J5526_08630 [Bacteroidales bacterium]|nr:hypothetical protein [Bacteroidales bacterium]